MKRLICWMTLCIGFGLPHTQSSAQEAADETAIEKPADDKAKDTANENKDADQPKEETYDAIRKLIRENQLGEATKKLEAALKDASDDDRRHDLRDLLAQSYLMKRQYDESFEQIKASFEHRLRNADDGRNQQRLTLTVSLLRMAALRTGKKAAADESIDRAIEAIDDNDLGVVSIQAMSMLLPQKAMQLAAQGDREGAEEVLQQRIERIDSLDAAGEMLESLIAAKSRLLYAVATLPNATDDAINEVGEYISSAVDQFPESESILSEFARVQSMLVARSYRDDPETAMERLKRASGVLENAVESNRNLKVYLARLKSYKPRIESELKLREMVGKPAPPMEIDAWANQGDFNEESLEGKVVLLDFWSVWCGPCIATFPHLREWYDEFHEEGFEIVGVTRYYGYIWDDEAKRAKRSKEEVESDEELETLEKFMQHHELRHPTIVTPKDSTMQKAYGVTGIPHAVLIDRKGNVQMVKVGSGSSTARQLHAKIQELIAE